MMLLQLLPLALPCELVEPFFPRQISRTRQCAPGAAAVAVADGAAMMLCTCRAAPVHMVRGVGRGAGQTAGGCCFLECAIECQQGATMAVHRKIS